MSPTEAQQLADDWNEDLEVSLLFPPDRGQSDYSKFFLGHGSICS